MGSGKWEVAAITGCGREDGNVILLLLHGHGERGRRSGRPTESSLSSSVVHRRIRGGPSRGHLLRRLRREHAPRRVPEPPSGRVGDSTISKPGCRQNNNDDDGDPEPFVVHPAGMIVYVRSTEYRVMYILYIDIVGRSLDDRPRLRLRL